MYNGSSPVGNHAFPEAVLWTAGADAQAHRVVHGPHPRVIHSVKAAPAATTGVVHTIHRPYDDDETSKV